VENCEAFSTSRLDWADVGEIVNRFQELLNRGWGLVPRLSGRAATRRNNDES
jgi:hypothetical protein